MPEPRRIQRKRAKGWRRPLGAITVTRPGPWGNPHRIVEAGPGLFRVYTVGAPYPRGVPMPKREAARLSVDLYEAGTFDHVRYGEDNRRRAREELAGHDLVCWCQLCERHKDGRPWTEKCDDCMPCHGDVLLRVANEVPA